MNISTYHFQKQHVVLNLYFVAKMTTKMLFKATVYTSSLCKEILSGNRDVCFSIVCFYLSTHLGLCNLSIWFWEVLYCAHTNITLIERPWLSIHGRFGRNLAYITLYWSGLISPLWSANLVKRQLWCFSTVCQNVNYETSSFYSFFFLAHFLC